jgi:hypothetical protein
MTNIVLPSKQFDMANELAKLAEEWELTIRTTPNGYLVQPEYSKSIHGLVVEEEPRGWRFSREMDATTWEDFLLMHISHRLAAKHGILLHYEFFTSTRIVEPALHEFDTFDHYADKVVSNEQGLVRDMKKNWIYTHRSRYIR